MRIHTLYMCDRARVFCKRPSWLRGSEVGYPEPWLTPTCKQYIVVPLLEILRKYLLRQMHALRGNTRDNGREALIGADLEQTTV